MDMQNFLCESLFQLLTVPQMEPKTKKGAVLSASNLILVASFSHYVLKFLS